jgi:hypothetical protein
MLRNKVLLLALATLTAATAVAIAQDTDPNGAQNGAQTSNPPLSTNPAPIERAGDNSNGNNTYVQKMMPGQLIEPDQGTASVVAAPGVFIRVGQGSSIRAIKLSNEDTELRVDRGVVNISVHDPLKHAQILIDLPGGQTDLIKDGFYTFNANTNTIRVLKGEAYAYPGANTQQKPIKVKEEHAVIFNGPDIRSFEFDPFEARADLIPYAHGGNYQPGPYGNYGYGPYAGYPYYDYGYPYYYGYPWGFGFYGGGFYGGGWGGYRGGYGGWGGGHGGWGGGGHGGGGGRH